MIKENLYGEYRPSLLDRGRYGLRNSACTAEAVWCPPVRTFNPAAQHKSPVWAAPDVWLAGCAPRRGETRHIALPTTIRRIAAAIGLWHQRARSRQQLRELSDHLLKDIGLRREDVAYEFPKPFRDLD